MIINDVNSLMRMKTTPEWDFEWDYTMGLLENQTGWQREINGEAATSLESNGEKLTAAYSAFVRLMPLETNELYYMKDSKGVMEATFSGNFSTTNNAVQNLRLGCTDSSVTEKITVYVTTPKFRIMDNDKPNLGTIISDFTNNSEYTIRITINGSSNSISINGNVVATNINTSTILYTTRNYVMWQNSGTGYYAILKSLKLKSGRI